MIARVNMKKRENRRCQNLLRAPLDIIITYLGRTVNRILLHVLSRRWSDDVRKQLAETMRWSESERVVGNLTRVLNMGGMLPKAARSCSPARNSHRERGAHTSDMSAFLITALRSDIFEYVLPEVKMGSGFWVHAVPEYVDCGSLGASRK